MRLIHWIEMLFALVFNMCRKGSFRQKLLDHRVNGEIFSNLFPHLQKESTEGYPFNSEAEMLALTDVLDIRRLLDSVEKDISRMPAAYGKTFRYIIHRDLRKKLELYANLAGRRVQRKCDPRFVARRIPTAS